MSRILAIAKAEYLVAVRSKAFIVGMFMMPIFMIGGIAAQKLLKDRGDKTDRKCVIVDQSGFLYPLIEQANDWRAENEIFQADESGQRKQIRPNFIFEAYRDSDYSEQMDRTLSARVESGELIGYAVISHDILDTARDDGETRRSLAYHTKTPSYEELPRWLEYVVNRETHARRFSEAGLDQGLVKSLSQPVKLVSLGLAGVAEDGRTSEAKVNNKIRTFAIPIAAMALIFMMIMMTAPTLLNQVLEEKIQKISEVLLSSVSPFQLLMGKLVGTVLVAASLSAVYLAAIYYATYRFGVADQIDPAVYGWFFLFLVLALFMYGSIFSAIGAACNEIKDAQSLMTPAMLLVMLPFFTHGLVLESPNGGFAAALSLFPPATPIIMFLRILLEPGPPLWQLLLSLVLTTAFAVLCVVAGGKIFRIGILSQGQTPTLWKLAKWTVSR